MINVKNFMTKNFEPYNVPNKETWFNTKTYWTYPLKHKDLKILANEIQKAISQIESGEYKNTKMGKGNRGGTISIIKKDGEKPKFGRPEEALERLIYLYSKNNNGNLKNQYQVSKNTAKKELVDLVEIENDFPKSLIELKQWKSSNSPLYAVIELLKYYYTCPLNIRKSIKNLILLAPAEYYQKFKTSNSSEFWTFIDELNNILLHCSCSILIKEINLSIEEWEKGTDIILLQLSNNEFEEKSTKRYNKIEIAENVDLSEKINNLSETFLKKLLKWENVATC